MNQQTSLTETPSDDIDSLIAMELAKREKETERMLKKKKYSAGKHRGYFK